MFTLGFEDDDDDGFLENSLCYLIPKSTKFLDDFQNKLVFSKSKTMNKRWYYCCFDKENEA